jgi:serine/threonine protein kinase
MPSKPLEPGDPVRLGRFELLGRLGEGGQGIVYLGRSTNPGEERVAVKVLRSTVDANVLERLARELDAIHQVQPFVTAGVIEASAEGDRRYVVSEFIDGPSLQERVDDQGPLSEGDLQRLAVGTATALTAIHGAGVVHRDFKPANVLLGPDGPRVVDFGIARLTDAATITSGLIGTPSYVAPEQLAGQRPTSAVDIFAWAVTMIYAATGHLAFGADSVPAVMHRIMYEEPDVNGLPPSLRTVVLECLDKDPARRPSARDLLLHLVDPSAPRTPAGRPAEDLVDSVPHTGPVYPPAGPTFPGYKPTQLSVPGQAPARSRRTPFLVAGGAVAAAIVVLAWCCSPGDHRPLPRPTRGATRWRAAPAAPRPQCRRPQRPRRLPAGPRSRPRSRGPGKARRRWPPSATRASD